MAGITKIAELEARKRTLVAECELCRQTLTADLQNLSGYTAGFFQKIDRVRSFGPWLMLAAPLTIPLFRMFGSRKAAEKEKASSLKGGLATVMLGFRLYRQYAPMVKSLASQFMARRRAAPESRSRSETV